MFSINCFARVNTLNNICAIIFPTKTYVFNRLSNKISTVTTDR